MLHVLQRSIRQVSCSGSSRFVFFNSKVFLKQFFSAIATFVVQFSCGSHGIPKHLEPVFGGFGLLCIADKEVPSEFTASDPLCCG